MRRAPNRALSYPNDPSPHYVWFFTANNNAITSRQLVDFVERKLQEHGIGKVVPNENELADAYRLFAHGREVAQVIERELAKLNGDSPVQIPTDLRERVARYLAKHPTMRWDEAVASVLGQSYG